MRKELYYKSMYELVNESILAFNVQNIYHLKALREFCINNETPVIVQFSVRYAKLFDELYGLETLVRRYKEKLLFFHLDHCTDLNYLKRCAEIGFDGVMYDGSALSLKDNIESTLAAKKSIASYDCLLEGEIGNIGGEEDGIHGKVNLVNIDDAILYYNSTKVDLLALGIGNAHGIYRDTSRVDVEILDAFNKRLNEKILLVLHGTSGLDKSTVHTAIAYGVRKINFSTDLKIESVKFNQSYFSHKIFFDETDYIREYIDYLNNFFSNHINQFGKNVSYN